MPQLKNKKKSVLARSFVSLTLALGPVLSLVLLEEPAFATTDPEAQLSSYEQDVATYQSTLDSYTSHYNEYDPENIQDLDSASLLLNDFSSAVKSFSSKVSTYTSALATYTTSQGYVESYEQDVIDAGESVTVSNEVRNQAQTTFEEAFDAREALEADLTTLTTNRDTAYSNYQSTINNSNVYEDFANNQVNSSIQFLISGTTPVSTTSQNNIYIGSVVNGTYMATPNLVLQNPTSNLQIKPPAPATQFQFSTGALNGNYLAEVIFTDQSTATFSVPNGVSTQTQPDNYTMQLTYNAPAGMEILYINIPIWGDYYALDNISFSTNSYDPDAYQTYLDAQASLDDYINNTYSLAVQAESDSSFALATAQSNYDSAFEYYSIITTEGYYENLVATAQSDSETLEIAYTESQADVSNLETLKASVSDSLSAVVLPPTSVIVTSLEDTEDAGTLRWAIAQANANSGGKYDSITFDVAGTITLTSNLPNPTQDLIIDSDDTVTIAGNFQWYVPQGVTLTINDLSFDEAYLTNERGVLYVNGSAFTNLNGYGIGNKNGPTLTFIDGTSFASGTRAIWSDWGNTPNQFTTDDSAYGNRIYITDSSFTNLSTAIDTERSVFVTNSTFVDNGTHIYARGINKYRIQNNTFIGGNVGIQTYSKIPLWEGFFDNASVTANNRYIAWNSFDDISSYAIYLDDHYDNQKNQSGATIRDNTWDETGFWVSWADVDGRYNETVLDGNIYPYYSLNNTSTAPVLNPPTNVVATVNQDYSVTISWDPATVENTTVERYAVFFYVGEQGWAVSSTETQITISPEVFESAGGLDVTYDFKIRADNDTEFIYSAFSETFALEIPSEPQPEPVPSEPSTPDTTEPVESPSPSPEPSPTPDPSPEEPETNPTPEDSQEQSPEETPSDTPNVDDNNTPIITPEPEPETEQTPEPEETPESTETESEEGPGETPTPTPEPEETQEPEPTPEPTVTPEPEPTPTAPETVEPEPTPEETVEPEPAPSPAPESNDPEAPPVLKEEVSSENIVAVVKEIVNIENPRTLTVEQQTVIVEAAFETFETAEKDSEEYKSALQALAVVAEADDPEIPAELAAVPLIGDVAGSVLEVFNDLGNIGADMSPEVREDSEKVVIAAVIVGQIALTASLTTTLSIKT